MIKMLWFILGPSGVGKSSFGEYMAQAKNWLHLEIDQFPNGDGIDIHNLREPWNRFFFNKDPSASVAELTRRITSPGRAGCVATFPGGLVLSPEHIRVCRKSIGIFYLYGSAAQCINAFLDREKETGRRLSFEHWVTNNYKTYLKMSAPGFEHNRVHVFTHMGKRRSHYDIFSELEMYCFRRKWTSPHSQM